MAAIIVNAPKTLSSSQLIAAEHDSKLYKAANWLKLVRVRPPTGPQRRMGFSRLLAYDEYQKGSD